MELGLCLQFFAGPLHLQKTATSNQPTNQPTNEGSVPAFKPGNQWNIRSPPECQNQWWPSPERWPQQKPASQVYQGPVEICFSNDFAHRVPGKIPQMFHQQFMKEFFLFEGLGKLGVSSPGMWAKSLKYVWTLFSSGMNSFNQWLMINLGGFFENP